MKDSTSENAIFLITCPDQRGIVAAVSQYLYEQDGNIVHADQHQDAHVGLFFMRVEWNRPGSALVPQEIRDSFAPIAERFQMQWKLKLNRERQKVALLVSKQRHCLVDLLYRWEMGELNCDIPFISSNHPDAKSIAAHYGIPFHHIPVQGDKSEAERKQLALLHEHNIDLVVLARYMQILSPRFVSDFPERIINVHHSLLPAFIGAQPHQAAYDRGVRLIGATSHYVTEVLDDGPIIEQDVARVSHRDRVEDLKEKGSDQERIVLARAVRWHLEHRILCYKNKTVVFD
jgi:formyltetrahydrofolate deformylase